MRNRYVVLCALVAATAVTAPASADQKDKAQPPLTEDLWGVVGCDLEWQLHSINSDAALDLSVDNFASFPIQLIWLDYEGGRVHYADIAPEQSLVQGTYFTHPWVLADLNGNCLDIVVPAQSNHGEPPAMWVHVFDDGAAMLAE